MKSSFTLFPTPLHYHWPSTSTNDLGSCSDSISIKTFQLHFPLTHFTLYNLIHFLSPLLCLLSSHLSFPTPTHISFISTITTYTISKTLSLSQNSPVQHSFKAAPRHRLVDRTAPPGGTPKPDPLHAFLHFPRIYSSFLLPRWPPYSSNLFSV